MKDLSKLSKKEQEILSRRRSLDNNISILSTEEMKRREGSFIKHIDAITKNLEVPVDISSQKEYFVNKKRYLMKLRSNLAKTCRLIINEIGRTVALLVCHHFGHFHVSFCTVLTEGLEVCFRQGNESGSVRKLRIICTHGMF